MILVKVYGAFYPAAPACFEAVARAGKDAMGQEEEWLFLEGDMLRIAFEGCYFPLDDVLDALKATLPEPSEGRLDYLDLEAWRLDRHVLKDKEMTVSSRGLNHVLEYAGH